MAPAAVQSLWVMVVAVIYSVLARTELQVAK